MVTTAKLAHSDNAKQAPTFRALFMKRNRAGDGRPLLFGMDGLFAAQQADFHLLLSTPCR